jgi:hypothetical protein
VIKGNTESMGLRNGLDGWIKRTEWRDRLEDRISGSDWREMLKGLTGCMGPSTWEGQIRVMDWMESRDGLDYMDRSDVGLVVLVDCIDG